MNIKRDRYGRPIREVKRPPTLDQYGRPVKQTHEGIDWKKNREQSIRFMIGEYIERGYVYISRDNMSGTVLFYHHANNELQDDIVFCRVSLKGDGGYKDERICVPRSALPKIVGDTKDVESRKTNQEG